MRDVRLVMFCAAFRAARALLRPAQRLLPYKARCISLLFRKRAGNFPLSAEEQTAETKKSHLFFELRVRVCVRCMSPVLGVALLLTCPCLALAFPEALRTGRHYGQIGLRG